MTRDRFPRNTVRTGQHKPVKMIEILNFQEMQRFYGYQTVHSGTKCMLEPFENFFFIIITII